jgi:hypothetical protein
VTYSLLSWQAAVVGAAVTLGLPSALAAQAPTPQDLSHFTTAGSYLAARHAGAERDSEAAAAYYLNVLKLDPQNPDLLSRTFLSVLTDGDIDEAAKLADRRAPVDQDRSHFASGDRRPRAQAEALWPTARQNFSQSVRGPVTDLTATMLAGVGACRRRRYAHGAIDTLDKLSGPDWYGIFKDLHAGLILDLANNKKEAGQASSMPTRSIRRRCARSRPMAGSCRATAARTMP